MSEVLEKEGKLNVGGLRFCQEEVDLDFGINLSTADGRQGVAAVIIQKEKEMKGCVWLCPDNALKVQIGKYSSLIAQEVRSINEAFKKTLDFFFPA